MKGKLDKKFIPFLSYVLNYHNISLDEWLVQSCE